MGQHRPSVLLSRSRCLQACNFKEQQHCSFLAESFCSRGGSFLNSVGILIKNVKRDFIDKFCGGWLSLKDVHSESCELYSLGVENSRVLKGICVDTAVRILWLVGGAVQGKVNNTKKMILLSGEAVQLRGALVVVWDAECIFGGS